MSPEALANATLSDQSFLSSGSGPIRSPDFLPAGAQRSISFGAFGERDRGDDGESVSDGFRLDYEDDFDENREDFEDEERERERLGDDQDMTIQRRPTKTHYHSQARSHSRHLSTIPSIPSLRPTSSSSPPRSSAEEELQRENALVLKLLRDAERELEHKSSDHEAEMEELQNKMEELRIELASARREEKELKLKAVSGLFKMMGRRLH